LAFWKRVGEVGKGGEGRSGKRRGGKKIVWIKFTWCSAMYERHRARLW